MQLWRVLDVSQLEVCTAPHIIPCKEISMGSGPDPELPETVTATALAGLLGVSQRLVRDLGERGVAVRADGRRYVLAASVQGYVASLREVAAGRGAGVGLAAERQREAKARADRIEMQNAVARREMVPAGEVGAALGGIVRDVRARMLAVPARVAQQSPTLARPDVALIEAEIQGRADGSGHGGRGSDPDAGRWIAGSPRSAGRRWPG